MPIVHVYMFEGREIEVKRKLTKSVTEAVVNSLNVKPELVRVIINEIKKENMSLGGVLRSDAK